MVTQLNKKIEENNWSYLHSRLFIITTPPLSPHPRFQPELQHIVIFERLEGGGIGRPPSTISSSLIA